MYLMDDVTGTRNKFSEEDLIIAIESNQRFVAEGDIQPIIKQTSKTNQLTSSKRSGYQQPFAVVWVIT